MVSMVLLTMIAIATGSVALMSTKDAERTILENSATAIVYSISDQLSALPLSSLSLTVHNDERAAQEPPLPPLTALPAIPIRLRPGSDADATTNLQIVSGSAPATALLASDPRPINAIDNILPYVALGDPSITTRTAPLRLNLWVWTEPFNTADSRISNTVKITIIYTINPDGTGPLRPTRGSTSFIRYENVANRSN